MLGQKKQSGRWDTVAACCSTTVSVETKNASYRQACRPAAGRQQIPSPCLACSGAPPPPPVPALQRSPCHPACRCCTSTPAPWLARWRGTPTPTASAWTRPACATACARRCWRRRPAGGRPCGAPCVPSSLCCCPACCFAGLLEHLTARPTQGSGAGREQGCRGPCPCHPARTPLAPTCGS